MLSDDNFILIWTLYQYPLLSPKALVKLTLPHFSEFPPIDTHATKTNPQKPLQKSQIEMTYQPVLTHL